MTLATIKADAYACWAVRSLIYPVMDTWLLFNDRYASLSSLTKQLKHVDTPIIPLPERLPIIVEASSGMGSFLHPIGHS